MQLTHREQLRSILSIISWPSLIYHSPYIKQNLNPSVITLNKKMALSQKLHISQNAYVTKTLSQKVQGMHARSQCGEV